MSHELHVILNVAVAVTIALIGGLLAHRLHQSVILGYLLAGVVIGPFTPGFIGDREQIGALAEVGVIFLMFALGIEFSLRELARMKGIALVGTAVQIALTMAASIALGMYLGWPIAQGLFFGGVIAVSSTMVVLKTLLDRGEVASSHGRVLLGMLIVQDLAAVLLMVVLPKLGAGTSAPVQELILTLVSAALFVGATLFLGARVVPGLMHRVEGLRSPELFLLTAVALALCTATASALLGLSPALGAFMAGLMLTETEFDHRVVAEVVPMRNLFATLFFVSVGMLIDPWFIVSNPGSVVGMAVFILIVKGLSTAVAVMPFRLGSKTVLFTSLGMAQIGEFSYVLANAGRQSQAIPESLHTLILTSSVLTIVLTPAGFAVAPILDRLVSRLPLIGRLLSVRPTIAGREAEFRDHVIVVGYGRVGSRVAGELRRAGLPVVVIEEDMHLVRELGRQGVPGIHGDASYASILAAAHPERARLVIAALPDSGATRTVVVEARRRNPDVPILARVTRPEDEESLKQLGATAVVAPEQAGALLLVEESKRALGSR